MTLRGGFIRCLWVILSAILLACCAVSWSSSVAAATTTRGSAEIYTYDGAPRDAQRASATSRSDEGSSASRVVRGEVIGPSLSTLDNDSARALGSQIATNSAGLFGTHSADDLAASAASAGKGEYSAAGHALTKHAGGQRAGTSAFPSLSGNPANINQVAQAQIDDILATGRVVTRTHPNHGPIIEVFAPDGRGARWYADGRFFGFLEP